MASLIIRGPAELALQLRGRGPLTMEAGSRGDGLILCSHWDAGEGEPWLEVVHADPVAQFSGFLLRKVRRGDAVPFTECDLVGIGGTVRIRARGRTLVYRLTSHDEVRDIFTGQWPD